ncbi:hypothetical protein I4U23_026724 [Adineta vaga]|nr:hypothetical protein I4U23_026724 [Adineta vaga]
MDATDQRFRTLLINVGNRLSMKDRQSLGFILGGDVPRQDLDTIARDSHASMNIIWDALIQRDKINFHNVDYLIRCFESIGRMDIVRLLKEYLQEPAEPTALFRQFNP